MENRYFNLHTHSEFCDGKEPPENYVRQAISMNFHTLGFSSHAPVPFENNFALKEDQVARYISTVRNLRDKYEGLIDILLSLEIDFIPGLTEDFERFRTDAGLDYTIGGVHLVKNCETDGLWFIDGPYQESYDDGLIRIFGGSIQDGVEAYYRQIMQMVETQHPDIIAHFDKIKMHNRNRFFSEEEDWYKDLVAETLKVIAANKCIIEVNTRGLYKKRCDAFFPGPAILEQILELEIPVTVSSDAHKPEELNGYLDEAFNLLRIIGFSDVSYFTPAGLKKQEL